MVFRFEEGFRRLTILISVFFLIGGAGACVAFTWSHHSAWREATTQPQGPQLVGLSGSGGGGYVLFPAGASENEIRTALADPAWIPSDGYIATAAQLRIPPDKAIGKPIKLEDDPQSRRLELAYVSDVAAGPKARFYDRKALKEGLEAGTLPNDVAVILTFTPTFSGRYAERLEPWIVGVMAAATVAAFLLPWGAFVLIRWLARGFSAPP